MTLLPCSVSSLETVWEWPTLDPVPGGCRAYLSTLWQDCWQFAAANRPTFASVLSVLRENKAKGTGCRSDDDRSPGRRV